MGFKFGDMVYVKSNNRSESFRLGGEVTEVGIVIEEYEECSGPRYVVALKHRPNRIIAHAEELMLFDNTPVIDLPIFARVCYNKEECDYGEWEMRYFKGFTNTVGMGEDIGKYAATTLVTSRIMQMEYYDEIVPYYGNEELIACRFGEPKERFSISEDEDS